MFMVRLCDHEPNHLKDETLFPAHIWYAVGKQTIRCDHNLIFSCPVPLLFGGVGVSVGWRVAGGIIALQALPVLPLTLLILSTGSHLSFVLLFSYKHWFIHSENSSALSPLSVSSPLSTVSLFLLRFLPLLSPLLLCHCDYQFSYPSLCCQNTISLSLKLTF